MNLDILFASRNNPIGLETTIRCLQALESGQHKITYIVGLDSDDVESCVAMGNRFRGADNIVVSIAERPICFGDVWNRCAQLSTAEYLMTMGDDEICLTQNWDERIELMMGNRLMVSSLWIHAPTLGNMPTMRRTWYEAVGYIYNPMIPFWFTDRILIELYEYVMGQKIDISYDIIFGGMGSKTKNMADLDFWWGFYYATRQLRIAEAGKVREKLGIPTTPTILSSVERRSIWWGEQDMVMRPRLTAVQAHFTHKDPMSPRYVEAKLRAEQFLIDNHLEVWNGQ